MKNLNNKQFGEYLKTHFKFGSSIADNPQGGPLAGLCLICSKSSSNTITIGGTECDTNATGVCGTTNVF